MMFFNCLSVWGLQDNKSTSHLLCYNVYLNVLHQIHQLEIVEVPLQPPHLDYGTSEHPETLAFEHK
jgi:hypothetical protein